LRRGGAVYRSEKNMGVSIETPKISLEQAAELLSVSPRLVALARTKHKSVSNCKFAI
jgi:hypothetical protein